MLTSKIKSSLGSSLKRRRASNDWTPTEASEKLCIELETYLKMEADNPDVSISDWCRAWNFYGVMHEIESSLLGSIELFEMIDEKLKSEEMVKLNV
jgi:hypothetical protein